MPGCEPKEEPGPRHDLNHHHDRQSPAALTLIEPKDRHRRTPAETIEVSQPVGRARQNRIASLRLLGPAFVAAVAYIDPGNYATNIQAGARYGYLLLWVVLWASLIAMLIQLLSSKLGIATQSSLASLIRQRLPRWATVLYWVQAELLAIATDLAEFIGASLGFHLLLGISLLDGAACTAAASCAILMLERRGLKPLELVIGGMLAVVAIIYVGELALSRPDPMEVLEGAVLMRFADTNSVLLAAGILGATIMPHVIYLHSALSQSEARTQTRSPATLFRASRWDVAIAMTLATFINMSMLAMAAAVFHGAPDTDVGSLEQAYRTLEPMLGGTAVHIFGASLIVAGISSTVVGTLAGQEVMQDFLNFRIPLWLRRAITMVPSLIAIAAGVDVTQALIASQVVLSFGIVFALVPLLLLTADRALMGALTNHQLTTFAGWVCAGIIVLLNVIVIVTAF